MVSTVEYVKHPSQLSSALKSASSVKTREKSRRVVVGGIHEELAEVEDKNSQKNVIFLEITIRTYPVILGDNPAVSSGLPLTLDWQHFDSKTMPLDYFEENRPERRDRKDYRLSFLARDFILRDAGYSRIQLREARKEIIQIQKARMSSAYQPAIKELLEKGAQSLQRKLKRWTGRTPSDRVLYEKWLEELDGQRTTDVTLAEKTASSGYDLDLSNSARMETRDINSQFDNPKNLTPLQAYILSSSANSEFPQASALSMLKCGTSCLPSPKSPLHSKRLAEILGMKVNQGNINGMKVNISLRDLNHAVSEGNNLLSRPKKSLSSNIVKTSPSSQVVGHLSQVHQIGEKNATFDLFSPSVELKKTESLKKISSFTLRKKTSSSRLIGLESGTNIPEKNATFDMKAASVPPKKTRSLKKFPSFNLIRKSSSGRMVGEGPRIKLSGEKNATFDSTSSSIVDKKTQSLKRLSSFNRMSSERMQKVASRSESLVTKNATFGSVSVSSRKIPSFNGLSSLNCMRTSSSQLKLEEAPDAISSMFDFPSVCHSSKRRENLNRFLTSEQMNGGFPKIQISEGSDDNFASMATLAARKGPHSSTALSPSDSMQRTSSGQILKNLSNSRLLAKKVTSSVSPSFIHSKSTPSINHSRSTLSRHLHGDLSRNKFVGKGNASFEVASVLGSPKSGQNLQKFLSSNLRETPLIESIPRKSSRAQNGGNRNVSTSNDLDNSKRPQSMQLLTSSDLQSSLSPEFLSKKLSGSHMRGVKNDIFDFSSKNVERKLDRTGILGK